MNIRVFPYIFRKNFSSDQLRLKMIESANIRYEQIKKQRFTQVSNKVDEYTKLFIKNYGNDPEILSCLRELMFNSRELLDSLLIKLNRLTKGRTSRAFLPFARNLMTGNYDSLNLRIIQFLKTNITYIFHIRKIRNEIKNNIANIQIALVTDHIEATAVIPIKNEEHELIKHLDINNKENALKNNSYRFTLILDRYFPEMIEFWRTALEILSKDT